MSAAKEVAVPTHPIKNRESINRLTDDFCPHTKERWLRKSCLICIDLEIEAGKDAGRADAIKVLQERMRTMRFNTPAWKALSDVVTSLRMHS